MEKNNLFNDEALIKIQKMRKIFLKCAVWILIAELVLGAIIISTGIWSAAIGKIQGIFLIFALVLFLGVNGFSRLEKGDKFIQIFALIGLVGSLIFAILACLLILEAVPAIWAEEVVRTYGSYSYPSFKYHMTFWMIMMLISSYATAGGLWISNIMSIKETIKIVKPLKITAIVCIFYLWIFGTIITPIEPDFESVGKLYQLAGLAGLAFCVTALAASIVSKANGKKSEEIMNTNSEQIQNKPKTDAELRAEIEEKVRREMIEKEVRAKIEAEQNAQISSNNLEDSNDIPNRNSAPDDKTNSTM